MFFTVTSLLAASIGLVLVIIIHPGRWDFHCHYHQSFHHNFHRHDQNFRHHHHHNFSPEIKAVVGSGNQAERKIEIMDNFLDLGRSMVPDNLFQVVMMIMLNC